MSRPASHRQVLGSVSALAITAMLAACSQPASYATVDLSGSYGPTSQTAQAYSPVTGQPVYQSASRYGPQSLPNAADYTPSAQLAYMDAPSDAVASLGYNDGGFDTYGILDPQPAPRYSPQTAPPAFAEAELLASPEFQQEIESVDRAFIDTNPLDAPAPFAEPAPFQPAPFEAAPQLESVEVLPADPAPTYDLAASDPVKPATPPWTTPKRSTIEEAELAPLAPPAAAPQGLRDVETVGEDYATIDEPSSRQVAPPVEEGLPVARGDAPYQPWVAPSFGLEEEEFPPQAPALSVQTEMTPPETQPQQIERPVSPEPVAQIQTPPAQASIPTPPKAGPDSAYTEAARGLLPPKPQQTRIPAPSVMPDLPPTMRLGGGLRVPPVSAEYPRPYELLRPGVWPELQNPGEGLVQAPAQTPAPEYVALAEPLPLSTQPAQPIARASERARGSYEIKRGDTLLTIAQAVGTSPEELAFENGMTPEAAIYIGQKLILPAPPARVVYEDGIPMIDVAEVSAAADASDIGGPSVPTMDANTANAIMGRAPIQRASIPTRQINTTSTSKRFEWPVHGEVYRLGAGQIEIEAEGNTPVAASAAGQVVHVERGPAGVLVVIEHDNGWRSLTVGLDYSEVRPGEAVAQGAMIGKSSREHRVRFELRDAGASVADALDALRG